MSVTRTLTLVSVLAVVAAGAGAQTADAGRAIETVQALGELNGQALACGEKEAVDRAKELMLRHAPRTEAYGTAFEASTQRGFLGQVKGGKPCPSQADLAVRLESIARELRITLPESD